ncbi:LAME_0H08306g1_1 [Lachancea meyersii CBS 8951]|uniref:Exonuclease V, mitochondrial n=1 Tax=Lachancea meyersii CBS 8951 TaxID=1266667 RepID=A0A1G4KFA3_9SACH|nr:LAME_0H08306g1_1 [Lachancea meyersii CBS 8951]
MRVNFLITFRRGVHLPSSRLAGPAISNKCSALTDEELKIIDDLPLFRQIPIKPSSHVTKARRAYLDRKLPRVRKLFRSEQEPAFLSYHLPGSLPNPYWDAHARAKKDPVTGEIEYSGNARLSVTKLLTKRWCELRDTYDIYSQIPIFEHGQVSVGRREHQRLEDETHATLENAETLRAELGDEIPDDPFHTLAENWYQTTIRLLALFQTGQAREVLCHGYLSSKDCQILQGDVTDEGDVLVSGIIDHLVLKKKISRGLKPTPLMLNLTDGYSSYDMKAVLQGLSASIQEAGKNLEIVVSDVKTRPMKTIPQQQSVVYASKIQVMYYRFFLENLSLDSSRTYQKLLINAQRRGFDLDAPINPAKLLFFIETNPVITQDLRRLRDGTPIGFAPYDTYNEAHDAPKQEYNWEIIKNAQLQQQYAEFFCNWTTPVTLRYFATRLAQMYTTLGPLLSKNLMIEYYSGNTNFHNISFEYDSDELEQHGTQSALFWFGKRNIEPIKPTVRSILTYCKHCDYESVCLWKKQGTEMCKGLGGELKRLHQEANVVKTD